MQNLCLCLSLEGEFERFRDEVVAIRRKLYGEYGGITVVSRRLVLFYGILDGVLSFETDRRFGCALVWEFRLVLRLFGTGNNRSLLIIPPVTARRILSSLIGQEDGVGGATSRPPIQSSLEP